jgi:hypothetical protein
MSEEREESKPEIEQLLSRMEADGVPLVPAAILDAVEHPCWEATRRPRDWRVYVPPSMRSDWDALPLVARLCVFEMAELVAMEEDPGASMITGSRR